MYTYDGIGSHERVGYSCQVSLLFWLLYTDCDCTSHTTAPFCCRVAQWTQLGVQQTISQHPPDPINCIWLSLSRAGLRQQPHPAGAGQPADSGQQAGVHFRLICHIVIGQTLAELQPRGPHIKCFLPCFHASYVHPRLRQLALSASSANGTQRKAIYQLM